MIIENHNFSDKAIKHAKLCGSFLELTVPDLKGGCVVLDEDDAKAIAEYFGLIPEPKTPEEVAEIERTVASSSRLNNGG